MNKKFSYYKKYTVAEFITDPDFIAWCKGLADADEVFWNDFLRRYPEQSRNLSVAKMVLQRITIKEDRPSPETVESVWTEIELKKTTRFPLRKAGTARRFSWLRVAAVLMLVLGAASLPFLFNGKKSVVTGFGETKRIELPDHSVVVLNARSSLSYSRRWEKEAIRAVTLDGEAYFEVTKDKQHPFIVTTKDGTTVEVVGTHFNVKAYKNDQEVQTIVLEGAVRVTKNGVSKLLTPGNKAIVPSDAAISTNRTMRVVDRADEKDALAWKTGQFSFNNSNIHDVMLDIARWYNVSVKYDGEINVLLNGNIDKNLPLTDVIEIIQLAGNVKIEKRGNLLVVSLQP